MDITMTLGEFRAITKDLPEDTEIFVDGGDLEFYEVRLKSHLSNEPGGALPPVLDHLYALLLELIQVVNEERDIDAALNCG